MKKNVNPMATCHDIGACLLHADDCACMRACTLQGRKPRRLAPGVVDGPYLRHGRARQFTMDLLVAMALIFAMTLLVDLVVWLHMAGWF